MVKEKIDIPDAGLSPVGHVTIDLMDESGNVIDRRKKGNYVHTRYLELINSFQIRGLVENGIFSGYSFSDIAKSIALTNNTASPDPENERLVEGDLVGGGNRLNVYDSDFLGNYNSAESVISPSYLKLVYDFGTATANGTFQSIYTGNFTPSYRRGDRALLTNFSRVARSRLSSDNEYREYLKVRRWFKGEGEFPHLHINGTTFSRTKELDLSKFYTIEDLYDNQTWETFTLPFTPTTVTYAKSTGKYYFVVGGTTSSWKIYSAPFEDPSNTTLELDRSMTSDNKYSCYGVFYENKTNTFLVVGGSGNSSTHAVIRYSIDFKVLEHLGNLPYSFTTPNISYDDSIIYMGNSRTIDPVWGYHVKEQKPLFSNNLLTHSSSDDYYESIASLNNDFTLKSYDYRSNYYSGSNSRHYVDLLLNYGFFSRSVLDSPVTKTAQNTMKITYEFTMDDLII